MKNIFAVFIALFISLIAVAGEKCNIKTSFIPKPAPQPKLLSDHQLVVILDSNGHIVKDATSIPKGICKIPRDVSATVVETGTPHSKLGVSIKINRANLKL